MTRAVTRPRPGPGACVTVALLLAAVPREAAANGRYPAAQYVVRGGGVTALRATWGLLLQRGAGEPFGWVCEEALGYAGDFDPSIAVDARGDVLVGLFDGLARLSPETCGVSRVADAAGLGIVDVDATRDGQRLVALWSSGFVSGADGITAGLLRSRDGGATWERSPLATRDVLWTTVEIDRADPARLWFTGVRVSPRAVLFARSDDFGATVEAWPLEPGTPEGVESAFVAGSDATDRDAVWVRAPRPLSRDDAGSLRDGTDLLRSTDGGRRWTRVLRADAALTGFALATDGRVAFAGGAGLGLLRTLDAGARWTRLADVDPTCLRWHEGALLVCADAVRDGFTLAESRDRGETLRPLTTFCDVRGPLRCDVPGATAVCASAWPQQRVVLGCGATPPPLDATLATDATATMDASELPPPRRDAAVDDGAMLDAPTAPPPTPPPAGCAVTAGAAGAEGSPKPWWAALVALAARRRRPRR